MRLLLAFCCLVMPLSLGSAAERHWAFTPPRKAPVPSVKQTARVTNPIDAFVLARLEPKGLSLSAPADKLTLLRRVTFDLTGLPPTVDEQKAFLDDPSPQAYRKVVDRLLASPRFGERWAQHWLDLVRYAESDGFKADVLRPLAHQYRDYVIRAFNDDLPYDRFIRQQIAGDELEPDNPEAVIATGFNRLWPDEDNAANLEQRRQEILDDVTDTTGQVFLGLTIGCARCHDHKYDPTTQGDYFQVQSFFAAMLPGEPVALTPAQREKHDQEHAAWRQEAEALIREVDALLADARRNARSYALEKFNADIRKAVQTPPGERSPYQQQIAVMAEKQLDKAAEGAGKKLTGEKKARYEELEKRLSGLLAREPQPRRAMAIGDVGPKAPPTHRLAGGAWHRPKEEIEPGFPSFLGGGKVDTSLPREMPTTGRRAALARWIASPGNPLTARVMVNRVWQHHFGVGLVETASDLGLQGARPTHPELLDWLAVEFVDKGWSLKSLHRLMVLSSTYQQSALVRREDSAHRLALAEDRDNQLLWHARRRRLEGEALRDAMLQLTSELSLRMYGPSARPKLPSALGARYAWTPDARLEDQNRRSVYVLARRNMRYPLFDVFDLPDMHNSCSRRSQTTTAPQALLMLNSDFTSERASEWARRLLKEHGSDLDALVASAYRQAWGREPRGVEVRLGKAFLQRQQESPAALADFCQAVLNTNEFLYVD